MQNTCEALVKGTLVQIHWKDAATRSAWGSIEEYLEHSSVNCLSIGYLLKKDKKEVVIAQTVSEDGQTNCAIAIPAAWVLKIQPVTVQGTNRKARKPKTKKR